MGAGDAGWCQSRRRLRCNRQHGRQGAPVDLCNLADRGTEKNILEALEVEDPDLVDQIRRLMFVFEDILLVNDKVFIVDLASAFHPGGVPVIGRWLVRLLGFADRLSLIKMKTIFAPELLTPDDRKLIKLRNRFMPTNWEL